MPVPSLELGIGAGDLVASRLFRRGMAMKKMVVGAVVFLASTQASAGWISDPRELDRCAKKILSGVEFNRYRDWPEICNDFEFDGSLQKRVPELKLLIEKSNSTNKEKKLIISGKTWIGATSEQAELGWGRPDRINRTTTAYGTEEQWVYGSSYLYLTDGRVTAIQN